MNAPSLTTSSATRLARAGWPPRGERHLQREARRQPCEARHDQVQRHDERVGRSGDDGDSAAGAFRPPPPPPPLGDRAPLASANACKISFPLTLHNAFAFSSRLSLFSFPSRPQGAIPEDTNVIIATNRGEPLVLKKKLTLAGIAYENAARRLVRSGRHPGVLCCLHHVPSACMRLPRRFGGSHSLASPSQGPSQPLSIALS